MNHNGIPLTILIRKNGRAELTVQHFEGANLVRNIPTINGDVRELFARMQAGDLGAYHVEIFTEQ
jgi:hypothetical protein